MDKVLIAKSRLDALQNTIAMLLDSEFPYDASHQALEAIREEFIKDGQSLAEMEDPASNIDALDVTCDGILRHAKDYLPYMGFILRSTNVRNAIELHAPLTRLARQIVSQKIQLVLSSEWEYSPHLLEKSPELENFAFIGFPAHESGNPLIAPIAAHELGHSLWRQSENELWKDSIRVELTDSIADSVFSNWNEFAKNHTDLVDVPKTKEQMLDWNIGERWAIAYAWAIGICEEYFCDSVGIRIFGKAYLHAFAYLCAPLISSERSFYYPNSQDRIRAHVHAAKKYGVELPPGYRKAFHDYGDASGLDSYALFLLARSDEAAKRVLTSIVEQVDSLLTKPELPDWRKPSRKSRKKRTKGEESETRIARITDDLKRSVPSENSGGLPYLLNAGWNVALENPHRDENSSLHDVLLKSFEVHEYELRTHQTNVAQS